MYAGSWRICFSKKETDDKKFNYSLKGKAKNRVYFLYFLRILSTDPSVKTTLIAVRNKSESSVAYGLSKKYQNGKLAI